MTQLKQKGDLFSVKVKKDQKGSKKKKKQGGRKGDWKKSRKDGHPSSIDAEPLTYKTLTVGQVLLGCIAEVLDYELVVSLPHKLVGSVSLAHISRPYTTLISKLKDDEEDDEEVHALQDLYQPGQYVVTSVVSIEKINSLTKVSLTLMPNEVNFGISASSLATGLVLPCAVASVEDKGYAMDTGITGINGAFLKKEDTKKSCTLGVGSVLRCIITNIVGADEEDSLYLTLSANSKAVRSATLSLSDTSNVALLLPGTAIKTTISKIQNDAVILMLADIDGIVSSLHLAKPFDKLKQYRVGDTVVARVLYVTPLRKVVHLTLQKSVCSKRSATDPEEEPKTGDILREKEIYRTSSSGIYVKLSSNSRGFCSGNHLSDKSKVLHHIIRDYPVGKKITCRLMKYNYMDQLFIVSLQKSVLEQQFVTYREMKSGQVVQATVIGYDDVGAKLAISKRITGHVPFLHLANDPVKQPKLKHVKGDHVTARILKVDWKKHHLLLTLKPRLVNANEPILTEYTEEAENMVTVGYIIKIMPVGLLIGMFNDVKGFAPKSQLGLQSKEDLNVVFEKGQVVQCKILKVYPEKKNIILSLLVDGGKSVKVRKLMDAVEMRSRVKCVVDEVMQDVIKVSILPENIKASIPVYHLSDYTSKCNVLKDLIKEGHEIINAVVFSKTTSSITLTLKSSVSFWIDHGSSEAVNNTDLIPKESYPAVVSDIKNYGMFVVIPSGKAGNRSLLHVNNVATPSMLCETKEYEILLGQSLYVSFKDRDEKNRPMLTSALKDNLTNGTQSSLQVLYSYLKDEEMVARGFQESQEKFAKFRIGDKVVALVTEVTDQKVHVSINNKTVEGKITGDHQPAKAALKVGQKVKACVLYVNQEEKSLELTLKPSLMLNIHVNKNEKLKIGMIVKCEVILAKEFFTMVVMKSECKGTVAYLPTVMHMNSFCPSLLSSVGKKCWMVVKHVEGPLVLGILKCHDKGEDFNLTSKLAQIAFTPCDEGEADSKSEEEEIDIEDNSNKDGQDMEDSETISEVLVDSSKEKTKKVIKKRQLETKETKTSKKVKTGNVVIPEQGDLNEEDSITNPVNEGEEPSDSEMENLRSDSANQKPCLTVKTGFVWDVPDTLENPELDSESEDEEQSKKRMKQLKKSDRIAMAQEEEQRLHQLELSRLEESQTPQSALEFEAFLQKSPNSSAVWIQFISFHLESAEVDKAKAVAHRALQVISTQEEEERLNIWTVLLRLEVLYGSPETVAEVYKEALTTSDHLKIHLAMAMVYAEANKIKEAEGVYFNMTKKFSQELSVWVKAGIFFFSHNMMKEGRHYMERALRSLDKKDHVELINRFGQLEFRFGEMERGRTMFESLLSTYWKRMDIWSVYVDLLTKNKDIDGARNVLERMTSLKLRLKKMRFVFKKFLDFEKEHGNSQSVEAVKQRVEEFVATTLQ
ncbi:protein RRP5 homolog [Portunus trituberculatus]|uniref:protein RRP5 homolog n=1 Tax=Portunus trituberculatus TaxID=210409 RepID=UPI001E1CD166|nr:protein RRP5 homolog [Portunus trituberculatus]XP_045137672.1 protein RRP5 homolog [Portunus trituberculatus]